MGPTCRTVLATCAQLRTRQPLALRPSAPSISSPRAIPPQAAVLTPLLGRLPARPRQVARTLWQLHVARDQLTRILKDDQRSPDGSLAVAPGRLDVMVASLRNEKGPACRLARVQPVGAPQQQAHHRHRQQQPPQPHPLPLPPLQQQPAQPPAAGVSAQLASLPPLARQTTPDITPLHSGSLSGQAAGCALDYSAPAAVQPLPTPHLAPQPRPHAGLPGLSGEWQLSADGSGGGCAAAVGPADALLPPAAAGGVGCWLAGPTLF